MARNVIDMVRAEIERKIGYGPHTKIIWELPELLKTICVPTQERFKEMIREARCDGYVLVDEYLIFPDQQKSVLMKMFREPLLNHIWTIRTTSNKMYRKEILNFVTEIKKASTGTNRGLMYTIRAFLGEDKTDFDEMVGLLLSEPTFKIEARQLELERVLTQEQFELEMLGRFLKDK